MKETLYLKAWLFFFPKKPIENRQVAEVFPENLEYFLKKPHLTCLTESWILLWCYNQNTVFKIILS